MRVRGLKPLDVVPSNILDASHPMRVRGLKPEVFNEIIMYRGSHPMRVRGLKLDKKRGVSSSRPVAPHAGAWIETPL